MTRKTLAAVLEQQNAPLSLCELSIPLLKKGQVLVQIAYSGVCQTQLNEIRGYKGPDHFLPHTLGHEGSGVVLEIGEGVEKVKTGDRVVLSWIKGKGHEVSNAVYADGNRMVQSGAISTFMEKAIISENRVIPIPREMPLREAALLGCAIPTGAGVIFNEMALKEGQSIAVFGAGGVGLSAILAARSLGAFPIIAVDLYDEKLEIAKLLGATHTINAKNENVSDSVRQHTDGKGVDFALESAGSRVAMEAAFASLKPSQGLCILAGNIPKGQRIELDPFDLIRGRQIRGTWGGKTSIESDISRYTDLFLRGSFPLVPLISHEFPLAQINEFMKEFEKGRAARGLIAFKNQPLS